MLTSKWLLLAASIAIAPAINAQETSASDAAKVEKTVEGATAGRVAQIERCQGQKFESVVEIDPLTKRSTRVKLCADPGSSDADWAKTLAAAVAQIEQRNMPAAAKDKLIGELNRELAKYAPAPKPAVITPGATLFMGGEGGAGSGLIAPAERYETSKLPPIPPRKVAGAAGSVASAPPAKPMTIRLKCLARGEPGGGATCDFFDRNTMLSVSAVQGLEDGGTLRFRRRGETQGEAPLGPMQVGQSTRVRLPAELCRGVSYSKVEIELLAPKSTGAVAARLGPYGLRC